MFKDLIAKHKFDYVNENIIEANFPDDGRNMSSDIWKRR